jgi:hypothetical protein
MDVKVAKALLHRHRQATKGRFHALECIKPVLNGFGI